MTMISLKSIKKGEELFNDYGQLPRSDLLRRYGYITDRYKQWDVVELSIDALKDCCNAHRVLSEEKKSQRVTSHTNQKHVTALILHSFNLPHIGKCFKMVMTYIGPGEIEGSSSKMSFS